MTHPQKNTAILWETCEEQYKEDLTFSEKSSSNYKQVQAKEFLPAFFKKWNVGFDIKKKKLGITELNERIDKHFKNLTQYLRRLKDKLKAEHGSHEASAGKCILLLFTLVWYRRSLLN